MDYIIRSVTYGSIEIIKLIRYNSTIIWTLQWVWYILVLTLQKFYNLTNLSLKLPFYFYFKSQIRIWNSESLNETDSDEPGPQSDLIMFTFDLRIKLKLPWAIFNKRPWLHPYGGYSNLKILRINQINAK